MRRIMHSVGSNKWLRSLTVVASLMLCGGTSLAATVGFNPSTSDVMVGDSFTVDIVGSEFTELAGGVMDLGFTSSLLTVNDVTVNSAIFDFLPDGGGPASGDTWPGIGFDTFVNDPASGSFTIATVSLTANVAGTANLSILGTSEFFSTTALLDPTLLVGTMNISDVPVPAAVWLFASGLLGLAGIARKKRA